MPRHVRVTLQIDILVSQLAADSLCHGGGVVVAVWDRGPTRCSAAAVAHAHVSGRVPFLVTFGKLYLLIMFMTVMQVSHATADNKTSLKS
jgi:hypothetical protein